MEYILGGKNMFNTNAGTLPVSIPLNVGGNGNGGVFGNGNGFDDIIALAVVAMIFGWNGNGYGGFGGGNFGRDGYPCATQADVRAAVDQQTLISKLDQQTYGLADTFTALNNTLNSNFRGIDNAICTLGYQNQQGFNTLGFQNQQCCCETQRLIERGFADTNYNMTTQANMLDRTIADKFCQTNFNIQTQTRDIIDSQNAGFRMLSDKIDSVVNNQKDAKIAEQACIINNQYLLSQINKAAVPVYNVQNPNCGCSPTVYGTTIA